MNIFQGQGLETVGHSEIVVCTDLEQLATAVINSTDRTNVRFIGDTIYPRWGLSRRRLIYVL